MEVAAKEEAAAALPANKPVVPEEETQLIKKNRIQVSTNKKPLYFYVNLAKRYMQSYNEVELSALGMAIGTVVTVAEILKNNGLATEKKILTSTVGNKDRNNGRVVRKAKIEILLGRTESLKDRKHAHHEKGDRGAEAGEPTTKQQPADEDDDDKPRDN